MKAGLSQLGLCLRSGVSRWRLRLCEQGVLELRADELERIVRVFKETREAKQAVRPALQGRRCAKPKLNPNPCSR
jgi:predicted transcriptional regulator